MKSFRYNGITYFPEVLSRGWLHTRRETCLVLFFVFLLHLVDSKGPNRQLPISPVSKSSDPWCHRDCSNARQTQICGSNDRTYNSNCEFKKFRACSGKSIKIKHKGPCIVEQTKCQFERAAAQDEVETSTGGVFIPQCNEDGSYSSVQCHLSFGYCWCVNSEGKPVPGSSVRHQRPSCNGEPTAAMIPSGNSITSPIDAAEGCGQSERAKFNENLRRIFQQEYERILTSFVTGSTERPTRTSVDLEKNSIDWKFTELDTNKDFYLSKKELAPMRRLMKKLVKPKSCVKSFQSHCDLDNDNSIAETEWSFCLGGVDNIPDEQQDEGTLDSASSREASPPLQLPLGSSTLGSVEQPPVVLSCPVERQRAAAEAERLPTSGVFIPQCNADSSYQAVQCHEEAQYCWCVYVNTGRPIRGTTGRAPFKEECSTTATSQTPVVRRVFRDCPDDKKGRFLMKLVDTVTSSMNAVEQTDRLGESSSDTIQMIQTILWEFHHLDTSRNGVLEEAEMVPFLTLVEEVRASKKCRRNFLSYCDSNEDTAITQREWLMCFEVDGAVTTHTAARRAGNPIIDSLT